MRKKVAWLTAFLSALFMVCVPLALMRWNDQQQQSEHARKTDVVYRSAQMSSAQFQQAVAARNIRTVASVREGQ